MANLWIRSQDKRLLEKVNCVYYREELNGKGAILDEQGCILGQYANKERCIEIIDEIQKLLLSVNPENAFVVLKNVEFDTYEEVKNYIGRARVDNFFAYFGDKDSNVQFLQPSVLVYEMPEE